MFVSRLFKKVITRNQEIPAFVLSFLSMSAALRPTAWSMLECQWAEVDISQDKSWWKRNAFFLSRILRNTWTIWIKPSQNSFWGRFYAQELIAKTCSSTQSSAAAKWSSQCLLAKFLLDYQPQWHHIAWISPWIGHLEKKVFLYGLSIWFSLVSFTLFCF